MTLEKLFHEFGCAIKDKHYQYRNLSHEELKAKAAESFSVISKERQVEALNSWWRLLGHVNSNLPESGPEYDDVFDKVTIFRFLCQTNLFFLCKLLGYSKVTDKEHQWFNERTNIWEWHNTHEEICNEFFVAKDPLKKTFERFAVEYVGLKERLLLVPRGGFKSSINMADCVQWVICFPEITIAILTGKLDLAGDFVGEVKAHFTLDENFEKVSGSKNSGSKKWRPRTLKDKFTGEETPSIFQYLFPEHCIAPDEGKATEFQTPACTAGDKEPTIRATGIEQSLAGSHFCLLKLDDVVTEENSLSVTRMEDINYRIGVDKALMHSFGFFDVIGTWYDERDYYGVKITWDDKLWNEGQHHEATMKIYRRAVWWPTEAARLAGKIESEWTENDVIMWFPASLSFKKMRESAAQEPEVFAIKYLNDPRKINKIKFPRELLIRCTLQSNVMPSVPGLLVTVVDTAYSIKSWADYTVILTAVIFGNKFYVVNMLRGRFNEYDLPAVIASTGFKWKPKHIVIEETMGTAFVIREIRREMDKLKISIPVRAQGQGKGSKTRSKANKAKPIARLLGDQRLYFMNYCEGLEEIYQELSQFTGTADDTHDDIVSALSLLVEVFAPYVEMGAAVNNLETAHVGNAQDWEMHQMIYGLGKYAQQFDAASDDNPVTQFQIGQAATLMPFEENNDDPLGDVFRGH